MLKLRIKIIAVFYPLKRSKNLNIAFEVTMTHPSLTAQGNTLNINLQDDCDCTSLSSKKTLILHIHNFPLCNQQFIYSFLQTVLEKITRIGKGQIKRDKATAKKLQFSFSHTFWQKKTVKAIIRYTKNLCQQRDH